MRFVNNARTDLAIEAQQRVTQEQGQQIDGLIVDKEESDYATVTRAKITNENAAKVLGKPIGNYVTIEAPKIKERDRDVHEEISKVLAKELVKMANLKENDTILVVGLGNWNATPDALGPRVVNSIMVTRHLHHYAPEFKGETRPVCALAPGVLGLTGIETSEIIKGVVEKIKPNLVIAIDALAAQSIDRISTTIQLADTGIYPGSGVGNKRTPITQETIGVKVIALGVPTVVHAATIFYDTINQVIDLVERTQQQHLLDEIKKNEDYIVNKILPPESTLMVTPKDVDMMIEDIARIVAGGINVALQPAIDSQEVFDYLH